MGCALLVLAGAAKFRDPAPTIGAMRALHLPSSRMLVRIIGVAEIALGIVAGLTGQPIATALVALAYGVFTVFVGAAMRSGTDIQSCGCFGAVDTPPSWVHLIANASIMVIAILCAVGGTNSLPDQLSRQPLMGIPFVIVLGVLTYMTVVVLTVLPTVGRSATTSHRNEKVAS